MKKKDQMMIDERFRLWQRNVIDKYKELSTDLIREDLIKNALPAAVLMTQLEGDFNFSNIIRTCNSFGIMNVFYFGKKRFDPRGACGTHHYANITYLSSLEEVTKLKNDFTFVGIENNIGGTIPLPKFVWAKKPLICFGEENSGIVPDILKLMDFYVEIPSRGSVRSMNVGSAASIVLYDYTSKLGE